MSSALQEELAESLRAAPGQPIGRDGAALVLRTVGLRVLAEAPR